MILPSLVAGFIFHNSLGMANVLEGILRVVIFLSYIYFISLNKDIKRVFQYHGAEHKSIYVFENKEELEHEKKVLTEQALNEGKPANIVEKMIVGRLNKFLSEISLNDQPFVKDPDQTVSQFAASKGGVVKSFVRYAVGEGIEKRSVDFAEEVMSQVKK